MRVTKQLISTTNACTLYNKGVSRVVVPVACNTNKAREVLKKENKEKMLNCLAVPNNFILSLSLSLIYSTLIISYLVYYVFLQVVARNDVSTKGFLKVSFVVSYFISYSTFSSNSLS